MLLDSDEDRGPRDHLEAPDRRQRAFQVFLARLVRAHDNWHGGLDSTPLLNNRHDRNPVAPEHRRDRAKYAWLIARVEAQIVLAYHVVHRLNTRALQMAEGITERMRAAAGPGPAMARDLEDV